jgi:fatty-acyl-CoA synthase
LETITLIVSDDGRRAETSDDRLCRSFKFYRLSKRKIHFVRPSSGMSLLEAERAKPQTGGKDSALRDWVRALEATAPIAGNPQRILPRVIEELAETRGDAPALLSAGECLTYRALDDRANRYGRWALGQNLGKGEAVCLVMPNRPEYLAIWLGISKVGGVVSLINTNLRGAALAHCLDIVKPQHIIVACELCGEVRAALASMTSPPKIWSHGSDDFARIDHAIEKLSGGRLTEAERRGVTIADRALHIYTSGTTGLPKAAHVSHHRLMQWSFWFAGLMNTGPDDRMYDCLPLYHSVGGVVATGAVLVRGGSVVIRDKFSAREFWDDVVNWDCTLFQYIGELCRYLANAPVEPREKQHRLRLCCGNGLRADVWQKFQDRFAIAKILEFYAATEGNVSLYNVEGRVGAVGRVPSFLAHRFPLALVKSDPATHEPIRDERGHCVRCATGEAGEAIGRIHDGAAHAAAEFEGYTDAAASRRKILRNVFERGDAWYRTGDLMRADASGYFYFVDRIGDTFRWKGENVASCEVAAAITTFPGISEATVYGVPIPGTEGAAGMAALVADCALDLAGLRKHLASALPAYARPLFLRIQDSIAVTATFKHQKTDLVRQGFDPAASGDAIYFDDPSQQAYVRLDDALFERIKAGAVRL